MATHPRRGKVLAQLPVDPTVVEVDRPRNSAGSTHGFIDACRAAQSEATYVLDEILPEHSRPTQETAVQDVVYTWLSRPASRPLLDNDHTHLKRGGEPHDRVSS